MPVPIFAHDDRGDYLVCRCGARIDIELDPQPDALGFLALDVHALNGARDGRSIICAACASGAVA